MTQHLNPPDLAQSAVLDEAHLGHIHGALGTILKGDHGPRTSWKHRLQTLLAIIGPGLIVMVGDNDAGAFGTYTQAGQNYGTALLWTLLLLVPVLYVNQEMVLRLGAVTGVGHARLILERFGKFWGAFSVIDLFLLNAPDHRHRVHRHRLGARLPRACRRQLGVAAVGGRRHGGGEHRQLPPLRAVRAGRSVVGSLLLVPIFLMVHPPIGADRARSRRAAACPTAPSSAT